MYKLLYNLIFVLGVPTLALATSVALLVVSRGYAQTWYDAQRAESSVAQEQSYMSGYQSFLQDTIAQKDMEVHIKQGLLSFTGEFISSVDNYITYKGFVLPQNILVHKDVPLKSKEYFADPTYSLTELTRYMNNMIFTTRQEVPASREKNPTIPITNNDLVRYFSLSCVLTTIYYPNICDAYVQQFLDVMYVYNLSLDYTGLQRVFDGIKHRPAFKDQFCTNVLTYMKYTNDSSTQLGPIMYACGDTYRDLYDTYVSYASVQYGLQNQASTTTVFKNMDVNAYKLISIQQEIYNELTNKKLNQTRIMLYLQFVEELLKRNGLDPVYVDMTYWFNNDYLAKQLQSPDFSLQVSDAAEAKQLLESIRNINKGSALVGYTGLALQLFGTELQQTIDVTDMSSGEQKIEVTLLQRFNAKFSFSSLRVDRVFLEGDSQIKVIGTLQVKHPTLPDPYVLNVIVIFEEYRGSFIVKKIAFADSEELSRIITNIAQENSMSMPQIYEYIVQNRDMFSAVQVAVPLCDQIVKTLPQVTVSLCSDTKVTLAQTVDTISVTYTVAHAQGKMKDIAISDPELQKLATSQFGTTVTNEANFIAFIQSLLQLRVQKQTTTDDSAQAEKMLIDTDFLKYLGVKTQGIMVKNNQTLVAFDIQGIQFIALYDLTQHTIQTLFFKKGDGKLAFPAINFVLDDAHAADIDSFTKDPLKYLTNVHPLTVQKYKSL